MLNIGEKDLPKEGKEMLDMKKDGDGEEVFGCLMDDMLYLAALGDLLQIAELRGGVLPEGFESFPESVRKLADQTLAKWEIYAQPVV